MKSAIKERPILFRAEMVRAILDGRKSQTRRAGKCQSDHYTELRVEYSNHATNGLEPVATYRAFPDGGTARWGICSCPFGKPGDRLWVRENFGTNPCYDYLPPSKLTFNSFDRESGYQATTPSKSGILRWRPSIHMPRWASRITLEIVNVRVERVQDISEEDAKAEGVKHDGLVGYYCDEMDGEYGSHRCNWRAGFHVLWDTMHAGTEFAWEKNPWVWVVEFKKVQAS